MQYLLDTSICVFFLRGKYNLVDKIKSIGISNCCISEITVFELRFGAENSEYPAKSHKSVDLFINGITVIPIYSSVSEYAKEKVRLRKLGKPMNDEFDLLIGVSAVANNLILVTDNLKHFEGMNSIKLENWIKRKENHENRNLRK